MITFGISSPFSELSPTLRQITHVLRTLAPLQLHCIATPESALDLHVLSTPPAFVLSQNQTLRIFKTLSLTQLLNHRAMHARRFGHLRSSTLGSLRYISTKAGCSIQSLINTRSVP